jgi:hypothetical protein
MSKWLLGLAIGLCGACGAALAADYRVEATKDTPPAELAPDVVAQISPTGYKVFQGEKRVVCEIWLAKKWATKSDGQAAENILYPFQIGSLMGVLRFPRKGADFRGQDIAAGVYTLRYADQPVDGNHVGTFATRDFLLMVPAAADQSPATIPEMDLFKASAQSAESTHPAIMPLVKSDATDAPAMRHIEENDWWAVRLSGQDAQNKKRALEAIVAGKAAE